MSQEIYNDEISEDILKEISLLYKIGVNAEELDYLINIKLNRKIDII